VFLWCSKILQLFDVLFSKKYLDVLFSKKTSCLVLVGSVLAILV
jgi:hypothetical protein